MNCNFLKLESWLGSIVTTVQLCNDYSPNQHRRDRNIISHFNNAGWSFSSFGGPQKVKEKLESIAHKEFNNDKFKDIEHIKNCQKTGTDLFHRNVESKKILKIETLIDSIIASYEDFFINLNSYNYMDFKKKADLMSVSN